MVSVFVSVCEKSSRGREGMDSKECRGLRQGTMQAFQQTGQQPKCKPDAEPSHDDGVGGGCTRGKAGEKGRAKRVWRLDHTSQCSPAACW